MMGQWASWADFWNMGGRAWFVWGSYGVTALCIAIELWLLRVRRRATLQRLARLARLRDEPSSTSKTGDLV